MVTQNMRSDIVSDRGLMSSSLSAGAAAKRTGQTSGFQDVMDRNLTKDKQELNSVSNRQPVKTKDAANEVLDKPDHVISDKTDTAAKSEQADNNPMQVEDTGDVIKEQLGKLIKKLQDVLGLSTEELAELMTQMGIGAADLCNQDNLMKLLLKTSGLEDPSSILTDETLAGQFNEMLSVLKEVTGTLEEEGISEDDLKQWLSLEAEMSKNPQQNESVVKLKPEDSVESMQIPNDSNVKKDQAEPLVEVIHKGEAVKTPVREEAGPQIAEESVQSDRTVVEVNSEDTGASEENLFLEKQDSTSDKGKASSAIETEEPKSQFESFMAQLDKNSKSVTTEIVQGQNGQATTVREIVNQVVSKIRMVIQPDMSSMELQLNPEHLGKVQLSVTAREGEMAAQFTVQNETAKAALEGQIQLLRENLNNQGLKVEAIEVTVSDFSFSQSNGSGEAEDSGESSRNHSRRQMNLDELSELDDDLSDDEAMAVRMMKQNGGSIDYTA